MNEVSKINKTGKIGGVLLTIILVITIIITLLLFCGAVVIKALPADTVEVELNLGSRVNINWNKVGSRISSAEIKKIATFIESQGDEMVFGIGDNVYKKTDSSVNEDGFELSAEAEPVKMDMSDLVRILVAAGVHAAAYILLLGSLLRLFKALKECKSLFEDDVYARLKGFAVALIPWAVLTAVTKTMIDECTTGVTKELLFAVDFRVIFLVIVTFALLGVFGYAQKAGTN